MKPTAKTARRDPPAPALARRILRRQFAAMRRNEAGVARGRIIAVHDMRVAVRRVRAALRAFREPLTATGAADIERKLTRFSRRLGPVRDLQTWIAFLDSMPRYGQTPFVAHQRTVCRHAVARLAGMLAGEPYRSARAGLEQLIETQIPALPAAGAPGTASVAAAALGEALRRVDKRSRLSPGHDREEMHRLRIACRRARYLAEFFSGVGGKPVAELAERLKRLQDELGDIHDLDVWIAHLSGHRGPPAPRGLMRELADKRRRRIRRFEKALRRCRARRFRDKLEARLAQWA